MIPINRISRLTLVNVLLVSTVLLTSCNKSKSKNTFIESARGVWQSGCQNYGIDNEYGQIELDVKEMTFEFTNTFYLDPQCMQPTVKYVSGGDLTKHENLVQDGEVFAANIDFLITQVAAELLSDAKRAQFNNNASCGLTNWLLNVSVDVSNCVDVLGTNVPRTEYDLYSTATMLDANGVNTDVLYLGQLRGSSASERSSAPDIQNPYWRIGNAEAAQ